MDQWIESNNDILSEINYKIDCFYDLILGKYPKSYREDFYQELINKFNTPENVTHNDIEQALRWKYGKKDNEGLAPNHINVIKDLSNGWVDYLVYLDKDTLTPQKSHEFWMLKLDRKTAYISVSYIVHLIHYQNDSIPIIDRFNWAATRYFLSLGGIKLPKKPSGFSHIMILKQFIELLLISDERRTFREIDKYLMMFGKHVAQR